LWSLKLLAFGFESRFAYFTSLSPYNHQLIREILVVAPRSGA